MIKFERSHIFIIVFFTLAFFVIVLVQEHYYNKRFKNIKLIEKQHEINITVERDYYNRGSAVFNDKYYIIVGRFRNSNDILNVLEIEFPYKLFKKKK